MGIKHFFYWYKTQMSHTMTSLGKGQTMKSKNLKVDTLLLDLNGNIHNATQKIFEYGSVKPTRRLLGKNHPKVNNPQTRQRVYKDVCGAIDHLVHITGPTKRIFLGIDGPAPIGKQNQQRQRRFRAASESDPNAVFDSNSITPGTLFMHELSIYIDNFIQQQKSVDPKWMDLEIVFSNEKVPGEGEHKAMDFIRENGAEGETYCINGMDADLIMLAMATHEPNFYIIRDDTYDPRNEYFCINIGKSTQTLIEKLKWSSTKDTFNEKVAINDFIFMCFMVGNDFLPHIPSIEIIEDGLELMIDIYRSVGESCGHLTTTKNKRVVFNKEALKMFLETVGQFEKPNFEKKLAKKSSFFPDPLMTKHSSNSENGKWQINLPAYIDEYNTDCFSDGESVDMEKVSHEYIQGLQWVITYYTTGCPSWKWYFPYQYAPTASTLVQHLDTFNPCKYGKTTPSSPFQQLLSVLPPKSANLIPSPLNKLLQLDTSPLKKYCPDKLVIDLAGKRKEWEGITILPMVDQKLVAKSLRINIQNVKFSDMVRNEMGTVVVYV